MKEFHKMAQRAKYAAMRLANLPNKIRNNALYAMADAIEKNKRLIIDENKKDMDSATGRLSDALLDRLKLKEETLNEMSAGLRQIAKMEDPNGEVIEEKTLSNGL